MNDLSSKKILMIVAFENFRDEEYLGPKEIFESREISVVTASTQTGEARGMLGALAKVDLTIADIDVLEYDAIVIVGGKGAVLYWDDELLHEILKMANKEEKILAAICVSPVTLASAGLLKNKKATCWPEVKGDLIKAGVLEYVDQSVVVDGRFVTANGPEAAKEFGDQIIEIL